MANSHAMNSSYKFQPYGKYNFRPGEIVSVFSEIEELNGFFEFVKEEKDQVTLMLDGQTWVKSKKELILEKTN